MEKNIYIPGDLVKLRGKVRKVIGTYKDDVMLFKANELSNSNNEVVKAEALSGMKLIPEILAKNGWKCNDIMPYPTYSKGDISEYVIFFARDKEYFKYDGRIIEVELKYVHQLQHLLFGLGLDFEMEV